MPRIGFRAHDFGSFDSADALGRRVAQTKKPAFIQLALKKVIPSCRPWQEWDEEYISSIASDLKAHGVSIAIVGCYINPIHPDAERRKDEIRRFRKSLSLTGAFGCPIVGTETGTANPSGGYSIATSEPRNIEIFKESLSQMLDEAEKDDAYVAIEAVARSHSISSAERMRKILDSFGTRRLKVIFDPINLIPYTGIAEKDGVPLRSPTAEAESSFVRDILDIYGDRIAAIHCKDYILDPSTGLKIGDLPALTGYFRWQAFAGELRSRGIDVPWLLENHDPSTAGLTAETIERF